MVEIREYLDELGVSPFEGWFENLPAAAAAKVVVHLVRLAHGNTSNVEPIGSGLSEKKIDWGPGLRIYFGMDGHQLLVLVGGSDKSDQARMIRRAKACWADYKARKRSRAHGTH